MLELFNIVDGRLSTKIDDIYRILNHVCQESLMTHHLPTAMRYIKEVNPLWYKDLKLQVETINEQCDNDFEACIKLIKEKYNTEYEIPPLSAEQKAGFEEYMINNSLLLNTART